MNTNKRKSAFIQKKILMLSKYFALFVFIWLCFLFDLCNLCSFFSFVSIFFFLF